MIIFVALSPACNTQLTIAISFGGPAWPISLADLNLGTVSSGLCLGAIFDITAGSNVKPTPGTPQWIVGDTFLVRIFCYSGFSGILTGLLFSNRT
jgi:cathepsin D